MKMKSKILILIIALLVLMCIIPVISNAGETCAINSITLTHGNSAVRGECFYLDIETTGDIDYISINVGGNKSFITYYNSTDKCINLAKSKTSLIDEVPNGNYYINSITIAPKVGEPITYQSGSLPGGPINFTVEDWKIESISLSRGNIIPLVDERVYFDVEFNGEPSLVTALVQNTANLNDKHLLTMHEDKITGERYIELKYNQFTCMGRYKISTIYINPDKSNYGMVDLSTDTSLQFTLVADVSYQTHVQDIGWQNYKYDGQTAGTTGQCKRIEAIRIKDNFRDAINGGIKYQTHIEDIGWQTWKYNSELSGTTGQRKRLEAIKIELYGDLASTYDVYYRVHAENYGWLDWAKNGEAAGTEGLGLRLEAIEILYVEKGGEAPGSTTRPFVKKEVPLNINYGVHVQDYGWMPRVQCGQIAGTTGQCKRLESIWLKFSEQNIANQIHYQTHVQDIGWQNWVSNGVHAGTEGQCKRLEAIKIELMASISLEYDVYYRVHAENFGWLGWAKNGEPAGTAGYAYRLEAIEVRLVKKGQSFDRGGTAFYQK